MPHFFCDRLNFLRARLQMGLSQPLLGGQLGLTGQMVRAYEKGTQRIPEERARRLQDVYGKFCSDSLDLLGRMHQHIAELDAMHTPVHEGDRRPHEHGQLHTPDFSIEDVFSDSVEKTS